MPQNPSITAMLATVSDEHGKDFIKKYLKWKGDIKEDHHPACLQTIVGPCKRQSQLSRQTRWASDPELCSGLGWIPFGLWFLPRFSTAVGLKPDCLWKIFGAKRDEDTGDWRKLHNTELHSLYSSSDIIRNITSRRLRRPRHVARMGEFRNAYRVLVGRPERKRPLGRPRRRWEDNIKMYLSRHEEAPDGIDSMPTSMSLSTIGTSVWTSMVTMLKKIKEEVIINEKKEKMEKNKEEEETEREEDKGQRMKNNERKLAEGFKDLKRIDTKKIRRSKIGVKES
ncbi:hypothetical protein ANN_20931 [Periplaneta americana]|uniref:Uncharacterized protein n=1 Tax=Periplaneta americana TaxID=6978 RepID=A0ABQ8SDZ7_PERAM|nr:hypothetical protein ANN_20931 [Periplaneta americana]